MLRVWRSIGHKAKSVRAQHRIMAMRARALTEAGARLSLTKRRAVFEAHVDSAESSTVRTWPMGANGPWLMGGMLLLLAWMMWLALLLPLALLLLLELVLLLLWILHFDKAATLCVLLLLGAIELAHRLVRLFVERLVCLVRRLLLHTMMRLSMVLATCFGV